jgi:hypothetical protein
MANLTVQDGQVGYPFPLGVECPPLRVLVVLQALSSQCNWIAPICRVRVPKSVVLPSERPSFLADAQLGS